jgi:hypothetical protein
VFVNDADNDTGVDFAETDFFGFTLQNRKAANSGLYQAFTTAGVIGYLGTLYSTFNPNNNSGLGTKVHSESFRITHVDSGTVNAKVFFDGVQVVSTNIVSTNLFTNDVLGLRPVAAGDVTFIDNLIITFSAAPAPVSRYLS